VLLAPVGFPRAHDLEGVVIDKCDPSRAIGAVGAAQVGHEDGAGAAMHRVWPGVAGLCRKLLGLDCVDDLRLPRVGLRIEHVRARRAKARDDQVTALQCPVMGMALVAKRAGARVPPEVVQFVACCGQISPADDLAVGGRLGIAVDHGHRIALAAGRIERCNVSQLLGGSRYGGGRRAIERGINTLGH
jgi:hypothetical protein